ncbi:TraY domain-containing protein [Pararhodobacter aggregans]|nr:TraY domain-containing protein [Pararhodobacter aggregans]
MAIRIPKKPVANIVPFGLRLQPELKAALEAAAQVSGRSLNSEISLRLQASFQMQDDVNANPTNPVRDLTASPTDATQLWEALEALRRRVDDIEKRGQ